MAEGEHDDYCLREYKYQFQHDLLDGKVAFITGGASGIGFRIAELLMRHGCKTIIGSRRMKKLEEVGKQEINNVLKVVFAWDANPQLKADIIYCSHASFLPLHKLLLLLLCVHCVVFLLSCCWCCSLQKNWKVELDKPVCQFKWMSEK